MAQELWTHFLEIDNTFLSCSVLHRGYLSFTPVVPNLFFWFCELLESLVCSLSTPYLEGADVYVANYQLDFDTLVLNCVMFQIKLKSSQVKTFFCKT